MTIPTTRRLPGEYVLLVSIALCWVFALGYWFSGTFKMDSDRAEAWILAILFAGISVIAFWLVFQRHLAGAIACLVFYGVQIISVTLPTGETISFKVLPSIYFRLYGDEKTLVVLSLVPLILFVFSAILYLVYRDSIQPHTLNGGN